MTIKEKIKEIIAKQLGVAPEIVTLNARLSEDLGADSLSIVELNMALEDEFELNITDEVAENIRTVGDIVECITKMQEDN